MRFRGLYKRYRKIVFICQDNRKKLFIHFEIVSIIIMIIYIYTINLSVNLKLIGEKIVYYKYETPAVLESAQYNQYFDRSIITDKTKTKNLPNIM